MTSFPRKSHRQFFDGQPPVAIHRPESAGTSPRLAYPLVGSERSNARAIVDVSPHFTDVSALHGYFEPNNQILPSVNALAPPGWVRTPGCFWYGRNSKLNDNNS